MKFCEKDKCFFISKIRMRIIGTGRAHPAKVVTNAMLEQFLDTSDEWIKERTGMSERRVITSEKLEDLAADAARRAIEACPKNTFGYFSLAFLQFQDIQRP